MSESPAIGIDIGGTNTKFGLVDLNGELLDFDQIPTPNSPPDTSVAIICDELMEFLEYSDFQPNSISSVGIGFPGIILQPEGKIIAAPNLKGWGNVDLHQVFAEKLEADVLIDNDANLAALAEYKWGAGKGMDPLVLFTLGTGVGGGIIIGGKIFHGFSGAAAELGHQTIEMNGRVCNCGNRGCLESIAGSSGVAKIAWEFLNKDKGSLLWELMDGDYGSLDAAMVGEAATRGDPSSLKIAGIVARAIGVGVANIMNILNPECILLAGGMTEWGKDLLLKPVIDEARKRAFKLHFGSCPIDFATWGIKAGVVGAAALTFDNAL